MRSEAALTEGPRRTSPRTVAAIGVSGVMGAIVFLGSLIWSSDNSPGGLLFAAGIGVARAGVEVATWWARTYTVGPTRLVVDEGLITRHHRVVPYARVQQVDLHRSFVSQVFGVAELRIDTAGAAGATTVRLRLLELREAEELRSLILTRRSTVPAGPAGTAPTEGATDPPSGVSESGTAAGPGSPAEVPAEASVEPTWGLLRCEPRTLVTGALTHSTVVAGVPLVLLAGLCVGMVAIEKLGAAGALIGIGVALLGAAVVVVSTLIVNVWQLWDYSLSHQGGDLHLRFGVLDVRQLTIPRSRVQQITITDNPVRRRMGLVGITLHSATLPGGSGEQSGDTRFQIPVLDRARLEEFLAQMMGDRSWTPPSLIARPPAARRRAIVRRCALLAVALTCPVVLAWPAGVVLMPLVVLGWFWGRLAHRSAGHGTSSSLVALARGAVHHRLDLIPVARIQSCRSVAGPLDRNRRLVALHVDIAGSARAPSLRDLDAATGDELVRSLPRRSGRATG
jgi:putative membrane protein